MEALSQPMKAGFYIKGDAWEKQRIKEVIEKHREEPSGTQRFLENLEEGLRLRSPIRSPEIGVWTKFKDPLGTQ